MKRILHREEGFTLIELMIVILIIAILVAIAIPIYLNSQASARRRTCQANLRTIDGGLEMYNSSAGAYPGSIAVMVPSVLKTVPSCPIGPTAYGLTGSPLSASCTQAPDHRY